MTESHLEVGRQCTKRLNLFFVRFTRNPVKQWVTEFYLGKMWQKNVMAIKMWGSFDCIHFDLYCVLNLFLLISSHQELVKFVKMDNQTLILFFFKFFCFSLERVKMSNESDLNHILQFIYIILYLSLMIDKLDVWKMKTFELFSKINGQNTTEFLKSHDINDFSFITFKKQINPIPLNFSNFISYHRR